MSENFNDYPTQTWKIGAANFAWFAMHGIGSPEVIWTANACYDAKLTEVGVLTGDPLHSQSGAPGDWKDMLGWGNWDGSRGDKLFSSLGGSFRVAQWKPRSIFVTIHLEGDPMLLGMSFVTVVGRVGKWKQGIEI